MTISSPIRNTTRTFATFALLVASVGVLAASESAQVDESRTNAAKNLARMNCGAKIECITPDGREATIASATEQNRSAAALIMDDATLSCPLQEGQTTFIITLPSATLVDRFTFLNENAAARGEVKIAVSNYELPPTSPKWTEVDGGISITNKRLFNLSMVGVEARYVKLSFNVEKGGRIASLGLYGGETLQRFSRRQQQVTTASNMVATSRRLEDKLNFNFANLYAKARVAYVSSGSLEAAKRMIDDDNDTAFSFAADDAEPTVILELAAQERLHRVSARYDATGGQMEVYLLNQLAADPRNLDDATPVASGVAMDASGKTAVDFDPKGARYVALRWTPATNGNRSFAVTEVNAFGDMPLAMVQLDAAPELFASNYSALQLAGEASPDLGSSTLGTLAVPPALPAVSQ